ncbi:hypothetical protein NX059_004421 [Plenodomus lindquistii]|nr:hypothetical protein NX059_004421 [Plenodomus lindquistii]
MSFYVYYGKLDNELLVAVLPNGTIEHNDPIYLYTKKWNLIKFKATDVKVTDGSEDLVKFKDTANTFQIVTKKAYKELALSITGDNKKTSNVPLTRHYDQPLTDIDPSNPPKIWTGAIEYHSWAKNEAFFVFAPRGLGDGKPVISIWQWTEDADKKERSLTYSTSKQQSQAATPNIFSFKHNGYYTLDCKVKADSLGVTVKQEKDVKPALQKELDLAATIKIGAEHQFLPPRPTLEKISLDCSYPQPTSSLPRYTGQLPFPADLVETLRYSAAYVDQAGYLAKHAVNQYKQLDRSFLMLEKKAEARAAKIAKLEEESAKHREQNSVLDAKNKELLKQIADNRAAAEAREAKLKADLQKTKDDLAASEDERAKTEAGRDAAEAEVKRQKDIVRERDAEIEKDKKADKALADKNKEHDKKDHEIIDDLRIKLTKSREAEAAALQKVRDRDVTIKELQATIVRRESTIKELNARIGRRDDTIACLKADLCDRDHSIVELSATLKSTQARLAEETEKAQKLAKQLEILTKEKNDLSTALTNETYKLGKAKDNLQTALRNLDDKDEELRLKSQELQNAQDKSDKNEGILKEEREARNEEKEKAASALKKAQDDAAKAETAAQNEQGSRNKLIDGKNNEIRELRKKLAEAEAEHDEHHSGKGDSIVHKRTNGVSA